MGFSIRWLGVCCVVVLAASGCNQAAKEYDFDGDGVDDADDCAPEDPEIYPGNDEICGDGLDNDCSGEADDLDADYDGHRHEDCGGDDCDDGDFGVHPGAHEFCNGVDDDCDGVADDVDLDQDGHVDEACGGDDCDDIDGYTWPGAAELADGADNDCDGVADEGTILVDDDGDGYCEASVSCTDGSQPGDCDDDDAAIHPGAVEACDGVDNDCDPATDELADGDADTVSICAGDCDDGDPDRSPLAVEICGDGVDNDCDGAVDGKGCLACDRWVPGDHAGVQLALEASQAGETICVEPGTYLENLTFGGREVTVLGTAGPASTVIDGGGAGTTVVFDAGEGPATRLEGFTVTGGLAVDGGGVRVDDSGPTLAALWITGNEASNAGGGLWVELGSPVLQDVRIEANDGQWGGGVYLGGWSTLSADGLVVAGNESYQGAGLNIDYGVFTGTSVRIEDNLASNRGGGIYCSSSGEVDLSGFEIRGNVAFDEGGGAYLTGSEMVLSGGRVLDNLSAVEAGGLKLSGTSELQADHVVIAANETFGYGGGVALFASSATLDTAILAGNEAIWDGGAISASLSSVELIQVSVVGNYSDHDGGAFAGNESLLTAEGSLFVGNAAQYDGAVLRSELAIPTFRYCDFWDNQGKDEFHGAASPVGSQGNVAVDPGLLDVSAPVPWGWDLHLSLASPVADAGDPAVLDPDGGRSDIGAWGGPAADGWDLDGDGVPSWWLPGPYDPATSPKLDCDDGDAGVFPGNGC